MAKQKRYLELYDEQGEFIARPDLYVLIRMSVRAEHGDADFKQAYEYIANASDNNNDFLNGPEAVLEQQYISGAKTERDYAAKVMVELYRLHMNDQKPTQGKALKLITHYLRNEKPHTQESSIEHQVKTAFRKWRDTCHLEAAFRIGIHQTGPFEADPKNFMRFLAMAKGFEMFMDGVCDQGKLTWNPWRVPEQIEPSFIRKIAGLSVEERSIIAAT